MGKSREAMRPLEEEFVDLWADCVSRHRSLGRSKVGQKKLKATARKLYLESFLMHGGGLYLRRDQSRKLRAAVLIFKDRESKRQKHKFVAITRPGDRVSLNWAKTILEDRLPKQGPCIGRLELGQVSLLPWLYEQGIGIRSVQLEGDIESSLRRLRLHYGKELRAPFEQAGLTITPAKTVAEIGPYLRLLQTEYRRNPQFGVHVTDSKFLKGFQKELSKRLREGKNPLWLIRKDGKLLGGVDIYEPPRGPNGKRRAGFGVNLTRKLQGKNYARTIYETILMELHRQGVKEYFGYTAQPGVMRLGKIMGRRLLAIEVDRRNWIRYHRLVPCLKA